MKTRRSHALTDPDALATPGVSDLSGTQQSADISRSSCGAAAADAEPRHAAKAAGKSATADATAPGARADESV